jgi:hypothetical protein
MTAADLLAICDDARDGDARSPGQARTCPVCGHPFVASGRARYCSRACQQRAYRLRRVPAVSDLVAGWATQLRQSGALLAQTVYVCPSCEQRYLGDRRCDECNLFCRNLGPGGSCAGCDEIVTVAELLGLDNSNVGR